MLIPRLTGQGGRLYGRQDEEGQVSSPKQVTTKHLPPVWFFREGLLKSQADGVSVLFLLHLRIKVEGIQIVSAGFSKRFRFTRSSVSGASAIKLVSVGNGRLSR